MVTQHIDLPAGWKWISLNVDNPADRSLNTVLASLNFTDGDMIKSGQLATFTTYYASFNSWFGSLTEVRVPVASPSPLPRRPCARPPCSPVSGSI